MKAFLAESEIETLPDDLREKVTTDDDGNHVLECAVGEMGEDLSGLKSALQKERDQARKLQKQVKAMNDKYGDIDPEEVRQTQEQIETLKSGYEKQIKDKDAEIDSLKTTVKAQRDKDIENEATKAISKAEGNVDLLMPHVKNRMQYNEESNGIDYLDASGNVMAEGNADKLIEEIRESSTFAGGFKATDHSGGGSEPGVNGGDHSVTRQHAASGPQAKSRGEMTDREKADYIKAHGSDGFMALPD